MRLIMMGTGPFAVPTFLSLLESPHEVAALVTRPAAVVRTRGNAPRNPMREAADSHDIRVLDPPDVNSSDARLALQDLQAQLLIVCDYGQILSADTLSAAPLGGINLHGSLLPKYRGAAPVQWAVWQGEPESGVSVIHMTPRLDAGPCLVQQRIPIGPEETAAELEPRLAAAGVKCVHDAIAMLDCWDRHSSLGDVQQNERATRAPRLRKQDGQVDWTQDATSIHNQVRALKPWPGTYTSWLREGDTSLRLILDQVAAHPDAAAGGDPGTVVACTPTELRIATGKGQLSISQLQPAGKRSMPAADFLRGNEISAGSRFGPAG